MKFVLFVVSSVVLGSMGCGPRSTPDNIPPAAPDLFSSSASSSDGGFEFALGSDEKAAADPVDDGAVGGFGTEPESEDPSTEAASREQDEPPPDEPPAAKEKKTPPARGQAEDAADDEDRGGFAP